MALGPNIPAKIEKLLSVWKADEPAFFWAPTSEANFLKDQSRGLIGSEIGPEKISYGGNKYPIGNTVQFLKFPTNFTLGVFGEFFVEILIWVDDPQKLTGCFFKLGSGPSDGLGIGAGNASFDDVGNKLIVLREAVAWEVGPSNAFVKGFNVLSMNRNSADSPIYATVHTTGIGLQTVSGSYIYSDKTIGINGYSATRSTNARVCAVAFWPENYSNIVRDTKLAKLNAPFTALTNQDYKKWFTPRQIYAASPNSASVYSDKVNNYNIRSLLQKDASANFNIRAGILSSISEAYNLRTLIQKDSAEAYNIRAFIQSSRLANYNIKQLIQKDEIGNYSIRAGVQVSSSQLYNLRTLIQQSNNANYNIRALIQSSNTENYNIRSATLSSITESYNIRSGTFSSISVVYNVLNANSISSSLIINYNIRNITSKDGSYSYYIRQAILSSEGCTYNIRVNTQSNKTINYSIRVLANSSLVELYNIRGKISSDRNISYLIQALSSVQKDINIFYNILQDIVPNAVIVYVQDYQTKDVIVDDTENIIIYVTQE